MEAGFSATVLDFSWAKCWAQSHSGWHQGKAIDCAIVSNLPSRTYLPTSVRTKTYQIPLKFVAITALVSVHLPGDSIQPKDPHKYRLWLSTMSKKSPCSNGLRGPTILKIFSILFSRMVQWKFPWTYIKERISPIRVFFWQHCPSL